MTEIVEQPVPTPAWENAFERLLRFSGVALALMALYVTATFLCQFLQLSFPIQILDLSMIIVSTLVGLAAMLYWNRNEEQVNTARLHYRLQLVVRYALAYIFVVYGMAKLYRTQLYEPFLQWLDSPLGELSGFALTWSFFGTSFAYSSFIGLSQILCSLLLCFRKTQLVGAMMLLPIIGNIVFVNFAYDVPVRLYSSLFLTMTAYLVLSELRRLKAFFWDNTAIEPRWEPEVSAATQKRYYLLKYLIIAAIFAVNLLNYEMMTRQMPYVRHPVFGVWEVKSYESEGEIMFQKEDPSGVWTKLTFEAIGGGNRARVQVGSETSLFVNYQVGDDQTLEIIPRLAKDKDQHSFAGNFELDEDGMILTGEIGEKPVRIELRQKKY